MSSPLINPEDLNQRLKERDLKIFDIRGKWGTPPLSLPSDYAERHIPGAIYLDWIDHFLEPGDSIPESPVATRERAARSFKELGICKGDTLVLYDNYNHMFAGRIWWAMTYWGFSNVKILNGGWPYWLQKGFPTTQKPQIPPKGNFTPEKQPQLHVSTEQVVERKEECFLIDGRGEVGYRGTPEDPRSGHIPGALNIPYTTLLDQDTGLFKDRPSLEAIFQAKDKDWKNKPLISSCAAGYAGSVVLVALKILGLEAPLYDGSFTIWKKEPDLPVEQGDVEW